MKEGIKIRKNFRLVSAIIILSLFIFASHEKPISAGAETEPEYGMESLTEALSFELIRAEAEPDTITTYKTIGYSYFGEPVNSWEITPHNYNKIVLLTFAMHGFEDGWHNDGLSLAEIAADIIREFSSRPKTLQETKLIVIPCVNPDGTLNGRNGKGTGRCNAQGIDINRDFDYYWQYSDEKKYRTGSEPFSTPEAQILRDVVLQEKPDVIIDFHGWLNCTYGDAAIADYFSGAFGIKRQSPSACTDNNYMQQFFTGWGSQYARTLLVEYPDPKTYEDMIQMEYSQKTINVIKELCSSL